LPVGIGLGGLALGYGLMKAGQAIGKGLNEFSMLNWTPPDVVADIKDAWTGIKWGINPMKPVAEGEETPTLEELEYATKDYSWIQKQELWLYTVTGGKFGKSHEEIRAEISLQNARDNQGGDF